MSLEEVLLYAAGAVLGLCYLFVYNSFLSSPSYMEHYFQFAAVKYTDDVRTLPQAMNKPFWSKISTWVTVLMILPMFLLQFVILTPWVLRQKVQYRIITSAVFSLVAALLVPVCAAGGGVSERASMAVLIISCIVAGGATTVLQSALFALFGSLPTKYITALVMGGGFSGSVNSVLRIIITVALPSTFSGVKTGAVIFFSIGMLLMVAVIVITVLLRFSPLVRSYCKDYRRSSDSAFNVQGEGEKSQPPRECDCATAPHSDSTPTQERMAEHGADKMGIAMGAAQNLDDGEAQAYTTGKCENAAGCPLSWQDTDANVEEAEASVFAVVRKIWLMLLCLAASMFTSLVLFPGIGLSAMYKDRNVTGGSTAAKDTAWSKEAIMPMVVILMFNVGDTIGRLIVNFQKLWCPQRFVPVLVVARAIVCVIPLALGISTPRVINSNANPIVVFLLLGSTNGYVLGLAIAYGSGDPRLTTKEREIAGPCICFAILGGITFGSVVSLLILTLVL
ncbi:putative Nucleoside transporter [Leishmania naiffi]|uniref:Nucleoside transporter n=1 Tax=Leishmania naiffi TaxID=5678 RepID=A0AAW3BI05_9TRYP